MAVPKSKAQMRVRRDMIYAFILAPVVLILIYNLYVLQIRDGEKYKSLALKQQLRPTSISAGRGVIYDRNMKTLAASATVWNVVLSPAEINAKQLEGLADFLSTLLDVDREKILERGQNKKSYYEIIKYRIEKDTFDKVTEYVAQNDVTGVYLIEDSKRYYPYGSLASTVLGFTGTENKGAYGLESYYEKVLAGTPGRVISAKNAKGGEMSFSYQQIYEPVNGNSLVLTIDEVVQHFLEKHLEIAVVEHNVHNRAAGIVMNIKTGEILAMATKPDFDPNLPNVISDPKQAARLEELKSDPEAYNEALRQAQYDQWRNKAISDPYEPGSVFKVITAAAALDSGAVKATGDNFYCPGYHIVAGRRKGCWKRGGHGSIDFTHAVKYSCNPAFMMVGERLGAERFDTYFEKFGLKELTKIDLPGEAEGIHYTLEYLAKPSGEELATSSFGQSFKVTPIQLITAVSAAVSGDLMQPYIVKQILDPDGNVISTTQPQVKRQVISKETAKELAGILERVVKDSDGSGRYAYVPGYRIGGKTGTSEKLDKRVNGQVVFNVASFVGISPSDDPEIAVLVLLDEPIMQNTYGSVIAAPVVGAIMADTLSYLGIEPIYTEAEMTKLDVKVPYVTTKLVHDATTAITTGQLKYRIVGTGATVTAQVPNAGQSMPRDGTVILYTDEEPELTVTTVPNVMGLSGQQANRTILNAGLNIKIEGVGINEVGSVAIKQTPPPGEEVKIGTVVSVEFAGKSPGS